LNFAPVTVKHLSTIVLTSQWASRAYVSYCVTGFFVETFARIPAATFRYGRTTKLARDTGGAPGDIAVETNPWGVGSV